MRKAERGTQNANHEPLFACLYHPPAPGRRSLSARLSPALAYTGADATRLLVEVAQEFSPRHELHGERAVVIDASGLGRLIGSSRTIAEALRRTAASRGLFVHIAIAATRSTTILLASARAGITIVEPGTEAAVLAPLPLVALEAYVASFGIGDAPSTMRTAATRRRSTGCPASATHTSGIHRDVLITLKRWGLSTLGDLAVLPSAAVFERLGHDGIVWRRLARGEDARPLVPAVADEQFVRSLDLDWPIDRLESLSFVLARLFEPLCARLEACDRAVAVLHLRLTLVTREVHARSLQLPTPIRDPRVLRTLALCDLEAHPPTTGIDRVEVVIDPTPGRVLQGSLLQRTVSAEQLSTLLARLNALLGESSVGSPAVVDSYRPGAFKMRPFRMAGTQERGTGTQGPATGNPVPFTSPEEAAWSPGPWFPAPGSPPHVALRRFRRPVPARVAEENGRPVRVTIDRRGFAGGQVRIAAGPWRTSGGWWEGGTRKAEGGRAPAAAAEPPDGEAAAKRGEAPLSTSREQSTCEVDWKRAGGAFPAEGPASAKQSWRKAEGGSTGPSSAVRVSSWNWDEWDVALADGGVYRIFKDRDRGGWFVEAVVD